VIAIDGKQLRGSVDRYEGQSAINVVSAWATANQLTLGQVKVAEKANEIVAIPNLLELLMLKNCIVTLDAIGCQKAIVKQIRTKEADYIVTVKANHPTLHHHIRAAFATADATGFSSFSPDYCETTDTRHGRTEKRQCWVLADQEAQRLGWQDGQTLVRIQRTTQRGHGKLSEETHYYLSSLQPLAGFHSRSLGH
jgi:predicted transposase YbfD/YdcC